MVVEQSSGGESGMIGLVGHIGYGPKSSGKGSETVLGEWRPSLANRGRSEMVYRNPVLPAVYVESEILAL